MTEDVSQVSTNDDVLIIGGGLIGLFSAYYLARAGRRVTILEKDRLGGGAARGNAGMIMYGNSVPLPAPGMVGEGMKLLFSPASAFFVKPTKLPSMAEFLGRFALFANRRSFTRSAAKLDVLNKETRQLFEELRKDGVGTELRDTPYLYTFSNRESAEAGRQVALQSSERGLVPAPGPVLERAQLLELEPTLSEEVTHGYQIFGELSANPSVLVDELIARIRALGVEAVEGVTVDAITEAGGQVIVRTGARQWSAKQVLVANGAWSGPLLKQLGLRSMVKPGKGYSFTVDVPEDLRSLTHFGDAHVAALPLRPGKVRIAGTLEFDGATAGYDPRRVASIVSAARDSLRDASWNSLSEEWSAPRPMTPDGLPHIGVVPGKQRTFVCTGHNMLGLSLGPSSGKAIADIMQGHPDPQVVAAFAPARFQILNRGR